MKLPIRLADVHSFGKLKYTPFSAHQTLPADENLSTRFERRCHCSSLSHGGSYLVLAGENQEEAGATQMHLQRHMRFGEQELIPHFLPQFPYLEDQILNTPV